MLLFSKSFLTKRYLYKYLLLILLIRCEIMTLVEVKTATITAKGQIVIPQEMRQLEGFYEGEKVVILAYEDHLEVRPLKALKRLMKGSVATALISEKSLSKDWEGKEEDEAWKSL